MPKLGETVPLSHQLHDGNETKFVQAVVRDASGTELVGSPFPMPHLTFGRYESTALSMPNASFLSVTYLTFDDSLFTELSGFTIGTDVFELVVLDQDLIDLLAELKDKLDTLLGKIDDLLGVNIILEGEVSEGEELEGIVVNEEELKGIVEEAQEVMGQVDEVEELIGDIGSDELEGTVEECD